MTRPKDIPADVWDSYAEVAKTWPISDMTLTELIARALMTYGQRRADEARESAATVCEDVAQMASDNAANANEPTLTVVFQQVAMIIGTTATAIRSQK